MVGSVHQAEEASGSMETKYLHSFIAVIEHGSFAEAARRLNLTPAALAARVKTLEEDIGATLIARAGRSVEPTEAGMKIIERARSIINETRDIRAIANNDEPLGELRLGVTTSTLAQLTPLLLKTVYMLHPKMKIFVESGSSSYLYQRAVTRSIDAAIMVQPLYPAPKGFEWEPVKEEPLVVIAPHEMRVADPHELLNNQPFLRFDRSMRGGHIAELYLRKHRIFPNERLEIDTLMTIACLVRDGVGVSLIPDWAPDWVNSLNVARLALPHNTLARNIGVFWYVHSPHSRIVRTIIENSRKLFPKSAGPA